MVYSTARTRVSYPTLGERNGYMRQRARARATGAHNGGGESRTRERVDGQPNRNTGVGGTFERVRTCVHNERVHFGERETERADIDRSVHDMGERRGNVAGEEVGDMRPDTRCHCASSLLVLGDFAGRLDERCEGS